MPAAALTLTHAAGGNNIVITMKSLNVRVRRIGNSQGVLIPKPFLLQAGLTGEAEMLVERGAIVLRKPRKRVREGWAAAAKTIAGSGDDELLMGEFGNAGDAELAW
jgi:antitoxin MazE